MDILLYCIIFMMGTVFGSFFTLAIYRIPLKKDITHERSFCPNCNHRLEWLDLIPIVSYIGLRGKCRYCGEKIRIRYFLLEILSGCIFLLGYLSFHIRFPYFEISKIMAFIAFIGMYITLTIVAGIDKEHYKIQIGVIIFGMIVQLMYMLYLYKFEKISLYGYTPYFIAFFGFLVLDYLLFKKSNTYILEVIILSIYVSLCIGSYLFIIVLIFMIVEWIIWEMIQYVRFYINDKADILKEQKKEKMPLGFFMMVTTVGVFLIENFLWYYK